MGALGAAISSRLGLVVLSGISIPFCLISSKSLSRLAIASASDPVRRLVRTLLALKPEWWTKK